MQNGDFHGACSTEYPDHRLKPVLRDLNQLLRDGGQSEVERGTEVGRGFDPYAAPVASHDFPADRQAHAGAGIISSMQPLEDAEHFFGVLGLNADAVVP